MKTSWLMLTFVGLWSVASCRAAEADSSANDGGNDARLVQQLGSPDFFAREQAAKSLLAKGLAVEHELLAGLKAPDLEIRIRADKLLSQIYRQELDRRLSAFVEGDDEQLAESLAGWKAFREVVGEDQDARTLFAEVYRQERELLGLIGKASSEREARFLSRLTRIQQELYAQLGGVSVPPDAATLAALLLVGSQHAKETSPQVGVQLISLLQHPHIESVIKTGSQSDALQKLIGAWVAGTAQNSTLAHYGMTIAMKYDLGEMTLKLARQQVSQKAASTSLLPNAILAIGRFGDQADIERLEPLLENKTVCHRWSNGKIPDVIKIEVRDVALAVLVHLTKQSHKEYGFDLLQKNESTLFQIYTCGFVKNEQREAAVTKWRNWRSS